MDLKEAFRFQNKLQSMMTDAQSILGNNGNITKVQNTYRKKSSYAEYRKTKSEMQDWPGEQKIVQEILKEDEQKKEQLHEQEVRQEEENRQSSR